jgi:hypothetical protein
MAVRLYPAMAAVASSGALTALTFASAFAPFHAARASAAAAELAGLLLHHFFESTVSDIAICEPF